MSFQGIDNNITDFASIISQELATLIKGNIDYIQKSIPIGSIKPIMVNIPGVAAPDPNIWQECNGSEITNPNSPLRSTGSQQRFTPNMVDRYIRGATTPGESGSSAGSNNTTMSHNHTGVTEGHVSPENDDDGGARNVQWVHVHGIASDLTTPISMEPAFMIVKFFMKIQ